MPEETQVQTQEAPVVVPTTETAAATETAKPESTEEPQKKNGLQRKFDRLTREKYELRGQNDELRTRLASIEERLSAKLPEASAEDPAPKPEQFGTYEEFVQANARWVVRQELKTHTAKQTETQQREDSQADLKATYDAHLERVDEAIERIEDYEDVVATLSGPRGNVPQEVGLAIMELDNGPDVLYHLAKNPAELARLRELTPLKAVAELGKISDKLTVDPEDSPPPKTAKAAPAPMKPLKKSAPTATGLSDDDDINAWLAKRNQQVRASGRHY